MCQLRNHETSTSALREIIEWRNDDGMGRPLILFSQSYSGNQAGNYGERLARYIVKHELGTITETPQMHNGNTDRDIKVWLWGIDDEALTEWAEEHDIEVY
mgnify:CR=1 FL=1